ncbi:Endonuclease domain-containing 1 protein, partial [Ophiophagus hannah]
TPTSSHDAADEFFLRETPPVIGVSPSPVRICQCYQNLYRFATLYDKQNRIPVYSVYVYNPGKATRPGKWMVEPQLINSTFQSDMETERDFLNKKGPWSSLQDSQSVMKDYKNLKDYNRGHLIPNAHQPDYSAKSSTFTLTNIVPQFIKLNGGAWKNYEQATMQQMTRGCQQTFAVQTAMLLLWILSLAASFLLPATGEVVPSFNPCKTFFLDGKPPNLKPMNPARICQLYKNKYRFATMYDRDRRIPLFSAYQYKTGRGTRSEEWMIEPQLALPGDRLRKNMELDVTSTIQRTLLKKSQAVDQDYKEGVQYDRGHLAPDSHQSDQDSKAATFTLTNIVPQFHALNNGEWRFYEEHINTAGCKQTYVIVGAVPGNAFLPGDRVNVPSHIWAAGCCVSNQNNQKKSWAVIAENKQNTVVRLTLGKLQEQLAKLYGKRNIDLFSNACNTPAGP